MTFRCAARFTGISPCVYVSSVILLFSVPQRLLYRLHHSLSGELQTSGGKHASERASGFQPASRRVGCASTSRLRATAVENRFSQRMRRRDPSVDCKGTVVSSPAGAQTLPPPLERVSVRLRFSTIRRADKRLLGSMLRLSGALPILELLIIRAFP